MFNRLSVFKKNTGCMTHYVCVFIDIVLYNLRYFSIFVVKCLKKRKFYYGTKYGLKWYPMLSYTPTIRSLSKQV